MTQYSEKMVAAEMHEVYKSDPHSGARILGGVSFEAAQGEVLLITGQSGSGKSTALRVLAGMEIPDGGEARVLGQDLYSMRRKAQSSFISQNIGMCFQAHNLDTNLTVYDNLVGLAESTGQYGKQAEARTDMLVDRLGLGLKLDQKTATLSGGEKMKVALGRLLVPKRALLLLDEPTGAVDPAGKADIFSFLREMQESDGSTIVMVSHDEQARDYADRQIVIESGSVVAENTLRAA